MADKTGRGASTRRTHQTRVGILGASGYMGGEALRTVLEHPDLELAWATSRQPRPAHHCHPDLVGMGIELIHRPEPLLRERKRQVAPAGLACD